VTSCPFADLIHSYVPSTSTIVTVHADQNILFHSLKSGALTRQIIGYNDEIVDAVFLSPFSATSSDLSKRDTHIALATNSSLVRIYSTSTLDARLLPGHRDIVLCLDHSPQGHVLASGSKDRSARLWAACSSKHGGLQWKCTAICEGHTESVGAIAMSRSTGDVGKDTYLGPLFTGSQDRTIKMWDLSLVPSALEDDDLASIKCKSLTTLKAHDKDINSLDVAPNDKFLASGSQDRTAKVHGIEFTSMSRGKPAQGALKLLGVCKGHKRGVWAVKFGKTERVLATGSGDKTVKLWSLEDFSCVKTFEGHTNSVLRVDFINFGMQMVSAASDGLVKLWNVKEEECMATMDNHEDKVGDNDLV
jgi:U3 small nucleolar RNA-associated protein 13